MTNINTIHGISIEPKVITDFGFCALCFTHSSPEYHHIVPRCSGGENSPQIRLCAVCHNSIHRVAISKDYAKGQYKIVDILDENEVWENSRNPSVTRPRVQWLVEMIFKSAKTVKNNPRKRIKVTVDLDGQEKIMIKKLKSALVDCNSQEDVLRLALRSMYKSVFKHKP